MITANEQLMIQKMRSIIGVLYNTEDDRYCELIQALSGHQINLESVLNREGYQRWMIDMLCGNIEEYFLDLLGLEHGVDG